MADGDNTRGSGRGTGRGRGRGRGRGTLPQPTHSSTSHTHVTPQPSRSTPSRHVASIPTHPSTSHTHVTPQPSRFTPSPLVLLTSQAPIAPGPPHPTPSPNNSTTQNQTIHPTPPQSHVASIDNPQVSSSHDDSYPQTGSSDNDGRMWICPGPGNTFDPPIQPTREITKIIKKKFEVSWMNYGEVKREDEKLAEMWFDEFKRIYKWLPEHEAEIKKSFDHKASDGYSNAMYRVRKKMDAGTWIPKKNRDELEQKWADEDWKAKAIINRNNRTSSDGSLHTGGSIPTTEHYKRLKNSSDETPTCWDLFEKTHKMKGETPKWVSSKAEKIANEYESRILERDSQEALGDGVCSEQSDNNIFLEVVGGVDKKKRIFGLGSEGGNHISSSKKSMGIPVSEYMQMKTAFSNLTAENQSLKEQVGGLLATQEKMLKFMETYSQNHPRPPSPPLANEDDQQNDNDYYDEELDC